MHCNAKTMIKTAAVLGSILAAAYLTFPEARALVAASAPVLLALICPISMVVMMVMMRKADGNRSCASTEPPRAAAPEQLVQHSQPVQPKRLPAQ